MTKIEALLNQYARAVTRLADALAQEQNEFMRDSAIQRFEFTFDLAWKSVKAFLEARRGLVCTSPKTCFQEAYQQKLIAYDEFWITLTDMRNETVHTYNEEKAKEIYAQLPKALGYFEELLKKLKTEK